MSSSSQPFPTIPELERILFEHAYVTDRTLGTVLFLALKLGKPLLLEGEAGVGKTQVAKTLAEVLDAPLIRLQCYEGLTRQLLHIRMLEAQSCDIDASVERDLFGEEYLIKRPLLQAIELSAGGQAPVLLIDELDRADEEFEAFLLELLSDFQITIPEIGTMRAARPPVVVITSNRTREIHDALKRRCIYHWIDYPTLEREHLVVTLKVPATPPAGRDAGLGRGPGDPRRPGAGASGRGRDAGAPPEVPGRLRGGAQGAGRAHPLQRADPGHGEDAAATACFVRIGAMMCWKGAG